MVGCVKKSVTSVSIHVRMGDYSDLLHGIPEAATAAYFTRAMNYFVLKYKVTLFALRYSILISIIVELKNQA